MKGSPAMHMDQRSSDEVVKAFQCMSAATRIDLLVRLLRQCLPLEIRFLSRILQETAKQSYEATTAMDSQVNRLDSYRDLSSVHDNPKRVCLSLALLRNENTAVATLLSRLLCAEGVVAGCCNARTAEEFEEYRLMYIMALHHPSFCFRDKEQQLRACLGELERVAAQEGEATGAEAVVVHGPHVLPMPSARAQLQQCEVTGLYKRTSDKRYVYSITVEWTDATEYTIYRPYGEFFTFQSKLLDLFPSEAGGRNKKDRVIPFLPGKRFPFSHTSKERAGKRFPEIIQYVRELMSLPHHITAHAHIMGFFTPRPQDHFLQDTLFEKIKALSDVQDLSELRRSSTLTHYSPPLQQAKDKSKTFPHKPAQGDPPTTSTATALGGSNPSRKVPGATGAAVSSPLYMKELESKLQTTLPGISESSPKAGRKKASRRAAMDAAPHQRSQDNTGSLPAGESSGDQSNETPYSTPVGSPSTLLRNPVTGAVATSAASTPGITTKPLIAHDEQSLASSVTGSLAPSPTLSDIEGKRSESCLNVNASEGQFSEENFLHWLKSHRLHKYASVFRGMTLEQICGLTLDDLRRKGLTQGAAKKFKKQIDEWKSHLSPGSLKCLISRHPSTFSLPSYIAETSVMSGILRSSSSQSLEHSSLQQPRRQRTTSVTSTQSSLCDSTSEVGLSETPVTKATKGQGDSTVEEPTTAEPVSGSPFTLPKEGPGAAIQGNGLMPGSADNVGGSPLPVWVEPAYYSEVPTYTYPDMRFAGQGGKPFPTPMGNGGIASMSVPMKGGKPEGLPPQGLPQQLPPLSNAVGYTFYQGVPVSHFAGPGNLPPSHMLPIAQMPLNGFPPHAHLVASQQPLLHQQFAAPPHMVPYSSVPPPSCYKCGQCGHRGHECTSEGMNSYGGSYYPALEQQPQPRSPDHPRSAQGRSET